MHRIVRHKIWKSPVKPGVWLIWNTHYTCMLYKSSQWSCTYRRCHDSEIYVFVTKHNPIIGRHYDQTIQYKYMYWWYTCNYDPKDFMFQSNQ